MKTYSTIILIALATSAIFSASAEEKWPSLPDRNGAVMIPAQSWPAKPGPREVRVLVHYPKGTLASVTPETGLFLTLHNWGGTDFGGAPSPNALATRLNVVALCVNYLQSGRKASVEDPEPYDCGYLQALDALRALYWIHHGLREAKIECANGRIFCTGGSGGGNVTLMANKLAPRTFACVVDLSGMKKLSDDIAFNLPGGTGLDARWSQDPASPNYLSPDQQEIRFVGHPGHLEKMKQLGNKTKMLIVHGRDDTACPFKDAEELVANLRAAGLDVMPHFIGKSDLNEVFANSGHSLGNRTGILFHFAKDYLALESEKKIIRDGPTDFERGDDVVYPTSTGRFVISYRQGFPIGRFEPSREKRP